MSNPVQDFLKFASTRSTQVRAHTRVVDGKSVAVGEHDREVASEMELAVAAEAERVRKLRERQAKEVALWKAWKDGGSQPRDLRPLLHSFGPLIKSKMNTHLGRVKMVPDAAIKAEYQLQFVHALRSYDPSKGSLGTYVYRYLDKAKRFITSYQNVGRIPENRIYRIKEYQNAVADMREESDKIPKHEAVAEKLGWTLADVKRMNSELRNDLVSQNFEEDPFMIMPSKEQEVLRLFKYELEGKERLVYEHLTGMGKPQITSTSEIGKELGIPDYQVSRIKSSIQKRLAPYLK